MGWFNTACWAFVVSKTSFRNTIWVSNSLNPDQVHSVWPDLGPNCLQSLADNKKFAT